MSETLFNELKNIGISEELAAKVSASLDPDHNASKKDVLIMQEAILQHQALFSQKMGDMNAKSDARYYEVKMESMRAYAELKTEIHTVFNRLCLVTFGSALLTIASVL